MKRSRCFVPAVIPALTLMLIANASPAAPLPVYPPSEEILKTINARKDNLKSQLQQFGRLGIPDPFKGDVEIYLKAAERIEKHNEYYDKDAGAQILAVLGRGLLRASQQLRGESPWYHIAGATTIRAYRSQVDGSVQPYAVTLPSDYNIDKTKKWHIEVVLHGRSDELNEVSFIHYHDDKLAPKNQDYVRIDIFGRGNNGYRWAGETDVTEAVTHFLIVERALRRIDLLDLKRSVLRGFSMGGAGVWHLGLHRPHDWCVLSPGAGFVRTHGYLANLPQLPPYQEAGLHIYDAIDYAENAFNVPVVAFAGAKDPQRVAALEMEKRLKESHIPMKLVTAPDLDHRFPQEWEQKVAEAYRKYTEKGRSDYPPRVRFVTYTLKYPVCNWVEIQGMEQHYQRAFVDAEHLEDDSYRIEASNVRILHLQLWPGATKQAVKVRIGGQDLEAVPYMPSPQSEAFHLYLEHHAGRWRSVLPEYLRTTQLHKPRKIIDIHGPIDDAFTRPFLCVRGTGKPWHEAAGRYAEANLERFRQEWSKYLRGELPVKDDTDLEPSDLSSRHLILFGDPSSNSLIAQILPQLPLKWTKDKITFQGREYSAAGHVPVMIYPSPLSPLHYVVLNSGHTFHAADFQGSNALLYPRLGDFAILKLSGDKKDPLAIEVQTAGLFDDDWQAPRKK